MDLKKNCNYTRNGRTWNRVIFHDVDTKYYYFTLQIVDNKKVLYELKNLKVGVNENYINLTNEETEFVINKIPKENWNVNIMLEWLKYNKISFKHNMNKSQLWELIQNNIK